jgi:hypothetical protein
MNFVVNHHDGSGDQARTECRGEERISRADQNAGMAKERDRLPTWVSLLPRM